MNYKEIRNYQRETLPLYTAMVIDPISRYVVSIILKFDIKIKPYIYTYFGTDTTDEYFLYYNDENEELRGWKGKASIFR